MSININTKFIVIEKHVNKINNNRESYHFFQSQFLLIAKILLLFHLD